MATTYVAPGAGAGVQPRAGLHTDTVYGEFDIEDAIDATNGGGAGGTAFALNDVIRMVKVPKGATILDVTISVPDLDTSTGIVLDVGDGTTADRFIDGSTAGQAGGLAGINEIAGFGYTYTADDTIDILVQVAATGTAAVTGVLRMAVTYTMQASHA